MISYTALSASKGKGALVLILVVMEDGLVLATISVGRDGDMS